MEGKTKSVEKSTESDEVIYKEGTNCMSLVIKSEKIAPLIELKACYDNFEDTEMKNDYGVKYFTRKSSNVGICQSPIEEKETKRSRLKSMSI